MLYWGDKMENFVEGDNIPLGFGLTLAQNPEAMAVFASLTVPQQLAVIEGTHQITSKQEMHAYVQKLAKNGFTAL